MQIGLMKCKKIYEGGPIKSPKIPKTAIDISTRERKMNNVE
jgi:hypothetical protein